MVGVMRVGTAILNIHSDIGLAVRFFVFVEAVFVREMSMRNCTVGFGSMKVRTSLCHTVMCNSSSYLYRLVD